MNFLRATVVKNFDTYWIDVKSEMIVPTRFYLNKSFSLEIHFNYYFYILFSIIIYLSI
jgi:hypothetical protein